MFFTCNSGNHVNRELNTCQTNVTWGEQLDFSVHVVQAAASILLVEGAAAREDKGGRFTSSVPAVKFGRS